MRKLVFALGLTSALLFALAAQAAAPNFAGTWTLDKSKSQGLSQRLQNAESVSWVITQTDKDITIEEKIVGGGGPGGPGGGGGGAAAGNPPAGGAPQGGGPGGGGQGGRGMGMSGPRTYNLDGTETTGDMGRSKYARKATLSSDGKMLELVNKITGQTPDGNEIVFTTTDKLSLSADGNVLTVQRHTESPRGAQDVTLVFNK